MMRVLVAGFALVLWSCTAPVQQQGDGAKPRALDGPRGTVWAVTFSPDGSMVAAASDVSKREIEDGKPVNVLEAGEVLVWTVPRGTLRATLKWTKSQIVSVAFAPDNRTVAGGGFEEIRLWDATTGELKHRLIGFAGQAEALAFSSDGKALVSINSWFDKNEVRIWDAQTGQLRRTLANEGKDSQLKSLALSRDGKTIVTGGHLPQFRGQIKIWDADSGTLQRTIAADKWVDSVALSPDGATLASPISFVIKLWDAKTGAEKGAIDEFVSTLAYSRDGKTLVGTLNDQVVFIDLARKEAAKKFAVNGSRFALSPDGQLLATGQGAVGKGTVWLWDVNKQP
jgi:WD40 repeat protein